MRESACLNRSNKTTKKLLIWKNGNEAVIRCKKLQYYYVHRTSELNEHMDHAHEQLRQVESDLEEAQGEKAAKLKELKQKELERKGVHG